MPITNCPPALSPNLWQPVINLLKQAQRLASGPTPRSGSQLVDPRTCGSIVFAQMLVVSPMRAAAAVHPDRVVQPNVPQGEGTWG